jgi:hypothetical protein
MVRQKRQNTFCHYPVLANNTMHKDKISHKQHKNTLFAKEVKRGARGKGTTKPTELNKCIMVRVVTL